MNLEETLRENSVVTCTGSKCMWKKKKRTHEVVTPVENMDFTRATIGKKKKGTCKPKATIFDPWLSYTAQTNPALEFRRLLLKCTASAVGLHVMAEPQLEKAVEDQQNLDVHSDTQKPQHEPYSIENLSPLPEGATLQQIKDACVAVKRRGAFLPQNAKELPVLNPLLPQLRL